MQYLKYLDRGGAFDGVRRILDIGAQNLYMASAHEIVAFVRKFGRRGDDVMSWAAALEEGSGYDANGFRNGAWLGELLSKAGFDYVAFDLFAAPGTRIFDLNCDAVPDRDCGAFDLVLNFGTTEHVVNQLNCLRVMHDATRVGGRMFHQVPATGHIDHGYFVYSPKLFIELTQANLYDLDDVWFSGSRARRTIFEAATSCAAQLRAAAKLHNDVVDFEQTTVPDATVNVLLTKRSGAPFRLPLETSTSVGTVGAPLRTVYAPPTEPILSHVRGATLAKELARRLRRRAARLIAMRS